MSGTTTATSYRVVTAFRGYTRGQIISDPATINAILGSSFAGNITPVTTDTGGGGTAGVAGTLSGVPAMATAGGALSGATYTLTGATSGFAVLTSGGSEVGGRVSLGSASGAVPAIAVPAATGTYRLRLLGPSGQPLADSGAISVASASTGGGGGTTPTPTPTATGALFGVPTTATAGTSLTGITFTLSNTATGSVVVLSGSATVSSTAVSGASGTVSALALPATAGSVIVQLRDAAGTMLWQAAVTVSAASTGGTGGTTTPPPTGGGTTTGKVMTGLALDASNKLFASFSDGTSNDVTAAISTAVAASATPVAVVDFAPAVTSVVPAPLACTGSVNFTTAAHHGRTLTFAAGGTVALAAPADATAGSWCHVLNTGTSQLALGAGIVSAGGNTVATGQSVRLQAAPDASGVVKLYAGTSLSNPSAAQTLSFAQAIPNQTAGNGFAVSLSYTNGAPSALEWATAAAGPWNTATGATIADGATAGTGTASFTHPGLASSGTAYTLRVRDKTNISVFAVSNAFTVSAAATGGTGGTTTPPPAQTLTVNTPAAQTAGTAFTVTGGYANGTPAALDVSTNGGSTYTAVASAIVSGGTYSFPLTVPAAGTYTIRVRDRTTGVSGASGTFAVAAAAGSGTAPTGPTWTLRADYTPSGGETAYGGVGNGWYDQGNAWRVTADNRLEGLATWQDPWATRHLARTGDTPAVNQRIEARFTPSAGSTFHLYARVRGDGQAVDGLACSVQPEGWFRVDAVVSGTRGDLFGADGTVTLAPGTMYDLRADVVQAGASTNVTMTLFAVSGAAAALCSGTRLSTATAAVTGTALQGVSGTAGMFAYNDAQDTPDFVHRFRWFAGT